MSSEGVSVSVSLSDGVDVLVDKGLDCGDALEAFTFFFGVLEFSSVENERRRDVDTDVDVFSFSFSDGNDLEATSAAFLL